MKVFPAWPVVAKPTFAGTSMAIFTIGTGLGKAPYTNREAD